MRFAALFLALVMLLTVASGALSFESFAEHELIGDADGDGALTVSDVLLTMRVAAKIDECPDGALPVYDVWNDGEVGVEDAMGILRSSVRMIGSFGRVGVKLSFAPTDDSPDVTQEMVDRAILSTDGSSRVAKVMQKAQRGEPVSIVTLGGSITAGSGASVQSKCYASRIADWWKNNFPQSNIKFRNSGIGATGSMLGVHRLERDVYKYNPDLLIVEFAVNDTSSGTLETYENLIRRVVTQSPDTAIVLLFMTVQSYEDTQAEYIPVGEAYGIPMISYRNAMKPEFDKKRFSWSEMSGDGVHPNDRGYAVVAGLLDSYFAGVKAVCADYSTIFPAVPENAMTSERFMDAKMYWCGDGLEPTDLGSWKKDGYGFYDYVGSWYVSSGLKPMKFTVNAKDIRILYERVTDQNKSGKIKAAVDTNGAVIVDSWFRNGWGDYQEIAEIYTSDIVKEHTLKFTCSGGKFRIAAILLS